MGVLKVIFLLISATVASCMEYVPVLVWSTQTTGDSFPVIPALTRLSSSEFSDYLLKRVKVENPMILVFMEENLSVEDFSWKDVDGNGAFPMLSNITRMADDVAFIPSVHDPLKGIRKLKNHGYLWKNYENNFDSLKSGKNAIFEVKLDEPDYLEDRPNMLKRHDEKMARIYNEALTYRPNIMVIYTGSHTSWIDAELERFKRDAKDTNGSDALIISDENEVAKMSAKAPIIYKEKGGDQEESVLNITKVIGATITQSGSKEVILRVRFPSANREGLLINFKFSSDGSEWWTLNGLDINGVMLTPTVEIGGPNGYSYFCNPVVEFTNGNTSVFFENFQVQPRVGKGNPFGPVIHCVPFFSIGIISGLLVVFILSVVLAWGITMIMDINTNDRFDDPKGKTITITATD